jgi:PAS domain S-box-containing protein
MKYSRQAPGDPLDGDNVLLAHTLAAIVQSSDDAIVSKDLNGIVISWNPAAERIFGWREDEIVGRSIMLIIPPERRHEEDDVLASVRRGERVDHFQTQRLRKDGKLIHISLTVSPVKDAGGRIIGASKVARDITARIEGEEALRRSAEIRDQFLSLVSHELRTPISVIVGNGQILSRRGDSLAPQDRQQAYEDIAFEAERLQRIIENLLLLTRVEAGEALELDFLHLERLVELAIKTVQRRSPERVIDFSCRGPVPAAFGDATLVTLILENLIGNADKYSPAGETIEVTLAVNEVNQAEVHVLDRGIGLSADDLIGMFSPFYRSFDAKERASGMGLGLAVCKKAVEEQGGHIAAAPRSDGGADFWFTLPVSPAPQYA